MMGNSCLKNLCLIQIEFLFCIVMRILLPISFKSALALGLGNETDRLALLALKDKLVDDSPGALNSWNDSLPICDWEGVKCGPRHQRVSTLNLAGLGLAGTISPFIRNLTFLTKVNFSYNKLKGNIPMEFGHLRRLCYIDLGGNKLQGQLPVELTNCSNLQRLFLDHNNLTGKIPFNLGVLKNLLRLYLGDNNLSGTIPSSFGNLSSLNILTLQSNYLEGIIPSVLGRLSNLEILSLGPNKLSGTVPPAVYNLSSITVLSLTTNQLSGNLSPELGNAFPKLELLFLADNQFTGMIPRSLSNISSLQQFDIGINNFFGSIPNNLGKLKSVQYLSLQFNNLGSGKVGDLGFLSSLANCSRLQNLQIDRNRFGGMLSDSIANLSTQLRVLNMGANQISGSIPEGIDNLFNLNFFSVRRNFLTGNIPNSIEKLQNLEGLYLAKNFFSGQILSSISNLTLLSELLLQYNNFEGRIPQSLRKCKSLRILSLSTNKLGSRIPNGLLGAFKSLIYLDLSHNSFTGPLASDLSSLKNLIEFYADNNNFFGEIPNTFGEIFGLRMLFLQKNSFQGNIPQSFASLGFLQNLDLSYNNLSGTIPLELQKLQSLVSLNVSFNHLEGEVPIEGVFKNVSGFSFFGNRKLCGGIPELELPKCFAKKKRKGLSANVITAMILSILLGCILAVLLVYLLWRQKLGKGLIPVALFDDGYPRLSYKELLDATQGFTSSSLIGSGSFGSVYKGLLRQHEKPIAVKVLKLQNHGAARSFIAECKILRKVRHRNLLKIITSCSSIDYQGNDFKALVFEFMPNGSLEGWLHEQHESKYLNLVQRLDIAIDVANAIDYLHHDCEASIVHCDLKPTNVLLDDDMVAHVGDFGLAKLLSVETSNLRSDKTTSQMIKGTIGYVAPEYGMGGTMSPEGDIYSYGIMLLEMITKRRPTDDLFQNGLNLHNFCKMALPERPEEILDFHLLEEIGEHKQRLRSQLEKEREIWECLVSFTKIGVACSVEVPSDRMRIKNAIVELHATKARLLRTWVYVGDRR